MIDFSLPYSTMHVYASGSDCTAGLLTFLRYAMSHHHSRFWLALITLLLQREGLADER